MHFDLTSTSLEDQQQTVARALELGARHIDVGQLPEEAHVVLADPEGNEFCVIEPGNNFLAGCGFIGALVLRRHAGRSGTSGATRWAGRWSGTRTRRPRSSRRTAARRSPGAVRRVTPKTGKNRLHFDIAPPADGDQQAEVDRLVSLGAIRVDIGQGEVSWVVMADPDGNEFCVLTPRYAAGAEPVQRSGAGDRAPLLELRPLSARPGAADRCRRECQGPRARPGGRRPKYGPDGGVEVAVRVVQ